MAFLTNTMQRIIGESSTLVDTLAHVSRIAPINRPVLIIGERGCGKELIAERLHFLSPRWGAELHKLNCAAISESLLDSELFGHEAGAFTGATKTHIGRFERAEGGTLFLDELATLPSRIQEKILRLIEYGEFERLGSQTTRTLDVRIVAATNEDLPKLADAGSFRHDLLDRLAFDVIYVPPLRHRIEDIPALIEHFATRMCSELDIEYYSGFSQSALEKLRHYEWKGNIRELKNVVERAVCHCTDFDEPIPDVLLDPFKHAHFSMAPSDTLDTPQETSKQTHTDVDGAILNHASHTSDAATLPKTSFSTAVKQLEIRLIQDALHACEYHQKKTAAYLDLSYHQLRALLKKYRDDL